MKYKQISQDERNAIYILQCEGCSKKQIAIKLNRHPSTITREIKRNSSLISHAFNSLPEKYKIPRLYHYLPDTAQTKRDKRRKQANYRPPCKNPELLACVLEKLKTGWSPDIISGILKKQNPYNKQKQISHECIYQFIYTKKMRRIMIKILSSS